MRILLCIGFSFSTFLMGCGKSHGAEDDPDFEPEVLLFACVDEFESCSIEAGACCDGHCFDTGYGVGTCLPRLADGQFCLEDDACRNGRCVDAVCGGPTGPVCGDEGATCDSTACCGDLVCFGSDGGSICQRQLADGAACESSGLCLSGNCNSEGQCGPEPDPATCLADGSPCGFGFEGESTCCGERECRYISYGIEQCITPRPLGEACSYSGECVSLVCSDGMCRDAECRRDAGEGCAYDHDCCTGFCTGAGDYGFGTCAPRLEPGESCLRDAWCLSRACTEGRCD